jgi:hypothetical protein
LRPSFNCTFVTLPIRLILHWASVSWKPTSLNIAVFSTTWQKNSVPGGNISGPLINSSKCLRQEGGHAFQKQLPPTEPAS